VSAWSGGVEPTPGLGPGNPFITSVDQGVVASRCESREVA
jgi:hypothetical protein